MPRSTGQFGGFLRRDRRIPAGLTARKFAAQQVRLGAILNLYLAALFFVTGMFLGGGDAAYTHVSALICAVGSTIALSQLRFNRLQTAGLVQAATAFGLGLALVPAHKFGSLALITFAILALVHAGLFIDAVRPKIQAHAVTLLSLAVGSFISGLLITQFWINSSAPGLFMALLIGCMLIFEWRIAHTFIRIQNAAPFRRFGDLQNAIERMGSGIIRFGSTGNVLSASRVVSETLGCEKYELAGDGFAKRIHVLDQPSFFKLISDAAHGRDSRNIELRVRKEAEAGFSGPPRFVWMEMSATSNFADADGANVQATAVVRDISARKEQQTQLEEARKTAEQAAQTKSRFLATIGHELRTPLNAIVGFSEMMSNRIGGDLSDAHAEYANHIQSSGRHLLDVVNMLLDMSKIEAGRFELNLEKFEVDKLIAPTLHMLDAQLKSKHINVQVSVARQLPLLTADERACRQILINLMSNAVKFSRANSSVEVSLTRQGTKLALTVEDHGVGMTPEEAQRVGEPFYQAQSSNARKYEGTGLGLSIVKGLVELHGGQLKVQSELDRGTRITVFLPIRGPEQAESNIAPLRSQSGASAPVNPTSSEPETRSKAS